MKGPSLEKLKKLDGVEDEFKPDQIIEGEKGTLRIDRIQKGEPIIHATYESLENGGQRDKLVFDSVDELRAFRDSILGGEHEDGIKKPVELIPGQVVELKDLSLHKVVAVQGSDVFIESLSGDISQVVPLVEVTPSVDQKTGEYVYEDADFLQSEPVGFSLEAEMTPENERDLRILGSKRGSGGSK